MTRSAATAALAVAVVAVLAAGCARTGQDVGGRSVTPEGTAPSSSANWTEVGRDAIATPVDTAVDVARQLRDQALVPANAVRAPRAPTRSLRQPPELPIARGVVVRKIWWQVAEPAGAAYRWVQHHQSPLLRPVGSSSTGGPATADQTQASDFVRRRALPAGVNSAQLSIEVVPVTSRTSAIGAFAVVVRQPPRPAAELVPLTVRSVSIDAHGTFDPRLRGLRRHITQTGAAALRTVRDFDALPVMAAESTFSCPATLEVTTLVFQSPGHTWRATVGDCVGISVTLNGRSLPALEVSAAFGRDTHLGLGPPRSKPGLGGTAVQITNRPVPVPTLQTSTR